MFYILFSFKCYACNYHVHNGSQTPIKANGDIVSNKPVTI